MLQIFHVTNFRASNVKLSWAEQKCSAEAKLQNPKWLKKSSQQSKYVKTKNGSTPKVVKKPKQQKKNTNKVNAKRVEYTPLGEFFMDTFWFMVTFHIMVTPHFMDTFHFMDNFHFLFYFMDTIILWTLFDFIDTIYLLDIIDFLNSLNFETELTTV